jgi:phosphoribosylformylglycinamidine synthase
MRSCVIVFPGSNCNRDAFTTLRAVQDSGFRIQDSGGKSSLNPESRSLTPAYVWHTETALPACDLVVVPGGFSYGDYLRSGAMAAQSPVMRAVQAHARRGGYVLGICNGFQILTEAGLLPGALMRNASLKFVCRPVHLRVENVNTAFTRSYLPGHPLEVPVAHHDGNYFIGSEGLKALEDNEQVAFRYCDAQGAVTPEANPNGSVSNIAGVLNAQKNVLGMMPHPERHAEALTGGLDGRALFESLMAA